MLPAAQAVPLPDKTSFEAGACLGIPAMTAVHAVALANVTKGMTLFVSGGAGAVSQYVIQFAKKKGAKIVTTISSAEKAKAALEAGADHTIDYKRENVGERVMDITGKHGVDAIIEMDLTANAKLIPGVLRPKGQRHRLRDGTGGPTCRRRSVWSIRSACNFFWSMNSTPLNANAAISAIDDALKAGQLLNRVAHPTYSLADTVAAHEAVERGTLGNVIVTNAR